MISFVKILIDIEELFMPVNYYDNRCQLCRQSRGALEVGLNDLNKAQLSPPRFRMQQQVEQMYSGWGFRSTKTFQQGGTRSKKSPQLHVYKFSLFRYVSSALNLRSIIFYPDHIFHFSLFLSLHLHETCLYYNQLLSTILFLVLNVLTHQKGSCLLFSFGC